MYGFRVELLACRLVTARNYSQGSSKKLLEFLATMPKSNSNRVAETQRARIISQKKAEKYGPSTVYLQVLGSGARGTPNTLYLFTDQRRYMINCGECTQRLAHEHKVKLSRLEHIFITSKTWRNIGGLPGLSLTLQDVGVPNITLHGPKGLDELYNATRRFVIMKDMSVTMAPCNPTADFEDSVMTVKYVLLGPHLDLLKKDKPPNKRQKLSDSPDKEFQQFLTDDTDYYTRETKVHTKMEERRAKLASKIAAEREAAKKKNSGNKVLQELQKMTNCTVAYICTLRKRMGTLDLAKCVELGVKPGPLLGQLKSGADVLLPDGKLVQARQVKTPDDPGPVFIVLEVPDLDYLQENEFHAHFDDPGNPPENVPVVIVHYTPAHVISTPRYRAFMANFGANTRHLILNEQNSCLGSEAVHRTQHKLHLLDPNIFPLLRDVSIPPVWNAHPPVPKTNSPIRLQGLEELKKKFQSIVTMESPCKGDGPSADQQSIESAEPRIETVAGRSLTIVHLRPKKDVDRSQEPKLHIQEYIQETMDVDGFNGSLETFRSMVDTMRYDNSDVQPDYPKVVFLGTGSCIPSKTRNTSCIVVHIDEKSSMLLDCGEGSYGQLVRFYGPKKVGAFLKTLKAIYVSHLHADHHIGLIGILQARQQAFAEKPEDTPTAPLILFAPGQILCWLTMYEQQFERIKHLFTIIPNQDLLYNVTIVDSHMTSAILASIGLRDIKTCYVTHCPNAFGVSIAVSDRHKITYSGDTVPCDELVELGADSTLLIHEATMEDELADEARVKMHSTTSQAIAIGERMRAQYTVLTHFSQRYARLPRLNPHILTNNSKVGIAFDNMQITMNDLKLLPQMYAPLQLMFAEHCVEMELKAALRARQKARAKSPLRASSPRVRDRSKTPDLTKDKDRRFQPRYSSPAVNYNEQRANMCNKKNWSKPGLYMENTTSRLRQQIKGMEVSGIVRRRASASPPPQRGCRSLSIPHDADHEVTEEAPRTQSSQLVRGSSASRSGSSTPQPLLQLNSSRIPVPVSRKSSKVHENKFSSLKDLSVAEAPKAVNIELESDRNAASTSYNGNSGNTHPSMPAKEPTIKAEAELNCQKNAGRIEKGFFLKSPALWVQEDMKKHPMERGHTVAQDVLNSILPRTPLYKYHPGSRANTNCWKASTPPAQSGFSNKRRLTEPSPLCSPTQIALPRHDKEKSELYCKPKHSKGSRSFKPQLEDIKSSLLLLSHKPDGKLKDGTKPVSKPKPLDEDARKNLLEDAKKKFQAKTFWRESKYDKIEGLNWISWK